MSKDMSVAASDERLEREKGDADARLWALRRLCAARDRGKRAAEEGDELGVFVYQHIEASSLQEFELLSRFLGLSGEADCEDAAALAMDEGEIAELDALANMIRALTLVANKTAEIDA